MKYDWDNAKIICEKDGYRYLLGPNSDCRMDWLSAIKWCQYMGGELPSKDVLNDCYENKKLRKEFEDFWYWSSTECDAALAWYQNFNGGNQYAYYKLSSNNVRAIKRIKL